MINNPEEKVNISRHEFAKGRIKKILEWVREEKENLFIAGIIFFIGMISFGLGRLSVVWPQKEPVTITANSESGALNYENTRINKTGVILQNPQNNILNAKGKYVASKSGTAYHFPWCAGALKIKETNKIWFETKEGAEKAGYKPAGNCDGL